MKRVIRSNVRRRRRRRRRPQRDKENIQRKMCQIVRALATNSNNNINNRWIDRRRRRRRQRQRCRPIIINNFWSPPSTGSRLWAGVRRSHSVTRIHFFSKQFRLFVSCSARKRNESSECTLDGSKITLMSIHTYEFNFHQTGRIWCSPEGSVFSRDFANIDISSIW